MSGLRVSKTTLVFTKRMQKKQLKTEVHMEPDAARTLVGAVSQVSDGVASLSDSLRSEHTSHSDVNEM